MTDDEKMGWAIAIAQDVLEGADFSYVYEEEDLVDASEEDLRDIHHLITRQLKVVHYEQ